MRAITNNLVSDETIRMNPVRLQQTIEYNLSVEVEIAPQTLTDNRMLSGV